jgi:hypothetical protein
VTCEPVGIWTNPLPLPLADLGTIKLLESDGVTLSDVITFKNLATPSVVTTVGAGPLAVGGSEIVFQSDPITPLPGALPLFATGIVGLGLLGWRRKRKAQAVLAT